MFRHPVNNSFLTKGLFFEENYGECPFAIFTLKDKDHVGPDGRKYTSLKRLYLEMEDPTEYEFANKYLDSYKHWKLICECTWFQDHIEEWRNELQLKLQARALKNLIFEAENSGKNSYDANKFLIAKNYLPKPTTEAGKRGRPSKQQVKEEAQRQVELEKRLIDDMSRLNETPEEKVLQ